jgi:hypothetical protein
VYVPLVVAVQYDVLDEHLPKPVNTASFLYLLDLWVFAVLQELFGY